jgi:hypothetical protein
MLLRRAALLWLIGRLMLAVFVFIYQGPGALPTHAVRVGTPTSLWLIAMVAALTVLDVHRRHEIVLLANLGVRPGAIAGLAALPAVALELVTCLIPV